VPFVLSATKDQDDNPTGPQTNGQTGTPVQYSIGATQTQAQLLVIGAPQYANNSYGGIPTINKPPPPPPPPSIRYENGKIYGSNFADPANGSVLGKPSDYGLVPNGPWGGNLLTGIAIQTPCDGTPGQYFSVTATAGAQSATLTINC
jgi:hypothetical protein